MAGRDGALQRLRRTDRADQHPRLGCGWNDVGGDAAVDQLPVVEHGAGNGPLEAEREPLPGPHSGLKVDAVFRQSDRRAVQIGVPGEDVETRDIFLLREGGSATFASVPRKEITAT